MGTKFHIHKSLIKRILHYSFLLCSTAESLYESTPSPNVNGLETGNVEEEENKVYKEYAAAQDHEGIHKYTIITIEQIVFYHLLFIYYVTHAHSNLFTVSHLYTDSRCVYTSVFLYVYRKGS